MASFKYAFILNAKGCTPENYNGGFKSENFDVKIYGVENLEAANALVLKLKADGIQIIELCGAFDEEQMNFLSKNVEHDIEFSCMKYFPEEAVKFEKLDSDKNYGYIVMVDGFNAKEHKVVLENDFCKTTVIGVGGLDEACVESKNLLKQGIDLIELCGAFDHEKARKIIGAIDGKIPVGFAGQV